MTIIFSFIKKIITLVKVLAIVALLSLSISFFIHFQDPITLTYQRSEITTTLPIFSGSLLLLCLVIFIVLKAFGFLLSLPHRLMTLFERQKLRKADDLIIESLEYLAKGEYNKAIDNGKRYAKIIGSSPIFKSLPTSQKYISLLIPAYASYLADNLVTAKEMFNILKGDGKTYMVGLRGLILAAQKNNDFHEVEQLIDEGLSKDKNCKWLLFQGFETAMGKGNLETALSYLKRIQKKKYISNELGKEKEADIYTLKAQLEFKSHNLSQASSYYYYAYKLTHTNETAIHAARAYKNLDEDRKAKSILKQQYRNRPSISIIEAWLELIGRSKPSYKNLYPLLKVNSNHLISLVYFIIACLYDDEKAYAERYLDQLNAQGYSIGQDIKQKILHYDVFPTQLINEWVEELKQLLEREVSGKVITVVENIY